jgi:hypothetical protein
MPLLLTAFPVDSIHLDHAAARFSVATATKAVEWDDGMTSSCFCC